MTIDLDQLEAAAKSATPGPWIDIEEDDENFSWGIHCITTQNRLDNTKGGIARIETDFNPPVEKEQKANAAYIAAVSPDVVLELIAELRAKNDLLEVYEWTEEHAKTALRNELKRVRAERDWLAEHIPNTVCPEGKSACDDRTLTAGGTVGYACLLCWLKAANEAVEGKQ